MEGALPTVLEGGTEVASCGNDGSFHGNGVVPVEYANSKLWGITSEYENLLNIQREHHLLAVQGHEAEAAQLRRAVEALREGSPPQDVLDVTVRAREHTSELAFQAKQKELELFAALLRTRDRQIANLQELCEARQAEIVQTRQFAGFTAPKVHDAEELRDEVNNLRARVTELEAVVMDKDMEINDMSQQLACKMQLVIGLQGEVQDTKRDRAQALWEAAAKLDDALEQLAACQRDFQMATETAEQLRMECIRHRISSQQFERKVEEQGLQLTHAEEALAQLLRSNSYKDQLVRSISEQTSMVNLHANSKQPDQLERGSIETVAELLRKL